MIDTPETCTALRLLKLELSVGRDEGTVKAVLGCMHSLMGNAGLTLLDAARAVDHANPLAVNVVMDRIGLHPSSEPELRAIQHVWGHRVRRS